MVGDGAIVGVLVIVGDAVAVLVGALVGVAIGDEVGIGLDTSAHPVPTINAVTNRLRMGNLVIVIPIVLWQLPYIKFCHNSHMVGNFRQNRSEIKAPVRDFRFFAHSR